jgi:hypothetical protein
MASINGIAHLQLTVSDMARSRPFYKTLLHSLEMVTLIDTENYFYCIGGRTGVAIAQATTPCCSKTRTASASKPTLCRARGICRRVTQRHPIQRRPIDSAPCGPGRRL